MHTTIPAKPQRPNKMQGALLRLCSQGRPHCTLRRILGHGTVYRGSQIRLRAVGLSHSRAMLLRRQHENRRGTRGEQLRFVFEADVIVGKDICDPTTCTTLSVATHALTAMFQNGECS